MTAVQEFLRTCGGEITLPAALVIVAGIAAFCWLAWLLLFRD